MSVSADKASANNSRTFITALITNAGLLSVEVVAFLILKQRLGRIYSPRTYLPPVEKRAQELPKGLWRWVPATLFSPAEDIIEKNGLDAYMFLRFIKMLIGIFFVFTIATFIILIPVDIVGIKSPNHGLERVTWSNISNAKENQSRFSAHIILAYLLTFFVFFMMKREMTHFIHKRHQFLISKSHSKLPQARTVLITSVPEELATEHDMRQFCSFVPGGIDRVWIFRDTKALNDLFQARVDACKSLEGAQAQVLRKATQAWRVRQIREKKQRKKDKDYDVEMSTEHASLVAPSEELLNDLVPRANRPTHRMGFLGIVGTKVDTIEWYKDEISRLNTKIKDARQHVVKGRFLGSIFVRCNLQMGAHVLGQCVSYHEPLAMYNKWMEANPKDIVWRNLDDGAIEMGFRYVVSWAATIALIFVWAFPAAFIGSLSNLDAVCAQTHWLSWFCDSLNSTLRGLIQGVLPPLLLAIVFAILPFILRALAWYECIPRYSLISVSVYRRFFLFLLIHGFLIVTVSSGITKAIEDLVNNPTSTVQTLANQLPGASTFFLTYMVTQGLSGAGLALIQLVPLLLHFIRKWFLGRTPRQAYAVTFLMPSADFGTTLPRMSLLATIGFAYSVITPIINVLALISFSCFYFAWKFLLTQVFDQPDEAETGGLYFPMAMENLFVGLYIEQICLACLFFLKAGAFPVSSIIEGVLMVVLAAITLAAQIAMHRSFNPIVNYLPMSLATKKMAKRYEHEQQKKGFGTVGGVLDTNDDGTIDLFSRERVHRLRRRIKAIPKQLDHTLDDIKAKVRPSEDGTIGHTRTGGGASIDTAHETPNSKDKREKQANIATVKEDVQQTEQEDKQNREAGEEEQRRRNANASDSVPLEGVPDLFRIPSASSKVSKASSSSSKKSKSKKSAPPVFDAPAPAGVDISDEEDEAGEEGEFEEHAFDHPSTYEEQPWIWLPKDTLGLSALMVQELKEVGVDSSDGGATMDDRGVVEVSRGPPDIAWQGGHDV